MRNCEALSVYFCLLMYFSVSYQESCNNFPEVHISSCNFQWLSQKIVEFFESCIILRSTFHLLKNLQLEGRFRGKKFSNASAAKLLSQSLDRNLFLSRFNLWYNLFGNFCQQLQSCRNLCPFPTAENCQNGKFFILKCISALKSVV